MQKTAVIFAILFVVFISSWVFKSKTPEGRPDSYALDENVDWWNDTEGLEVDEEWILDPEIPSNYLPVPGEDNLFMVVDDKGNVVSYRKRKAQEDGSYLWEDTNPDIPDNYIPVKGLKNVYKVKHEDGSVTYLKYVRNDDGTFAFVEVDKNGKLKVPKKTEEAVPENYVEVGKNTYAVKDNNNVTVGYVNRTTNKDGTYGWAETTKPNISNNNITHIQNETTTQNNIPEMPTNTPVEQETTSGAYVIGNGTEYETEKSTVQNKDNTYTETEIFRETKVSGDWEIVYVTKVTRVYDATGTLISTKKEEPFIESKTKKVTSEEAPNKALIEKTLDNELTRVSKKVTYKDELASEVTALLNAERKNSGIDTLSTNNKSDAVKIAKLLAADMAIYNYANGDSPMYGNMDELTNRFDIKCSITPGKIAWKSTSDTAEQINRKILQTSSDICLSKQYSQVGVAVVEKNGYYYIVEVFIK